MTSRVWDNIPNVKFWTQSVLPATFDDSLSYYEVLAKMVSKLNEIIDIVNAQGTGINSYIEELFDTYKDQWNAEQDAKLNAVQANLSGQIQSLSQQITSYQNNTDLKFAAFQNQINADISAFKTLVNKQINDLHQLIVSTDQGNRQWTIGLLEEFKSSLPTHLPPIIDPTDGKLEDVQTVVNHIWDALNKNSITAEEYDSLELTATEYDSKQITATAYDQTGKIILMPDALKGDDA